MSSDEVKDLLCSAGTLFVYLVVGGAGVGCGAALVIWILRLVMGPL